MNDTARLGYMQARIQARHGDRLDAEQWRQLDACRDLGRFLQLARESNLRQWVRHFAAQEDPVEWERSLRADWNSNLLQLADWVTDRWRPGMLWLQSLPVLPAISHLLNGEPAAAWMQDEPFFDTLDLADPEAFRESLGASRWAGLLNDWDPRHPVESWLSSWRKLWPAGDARTTQVLEQACAGIAATWQDPTIAGADWRENLEQQFTALLRRHPRTIPAMIGHIGLVSLDMFHLRAGLLDLHVSARPAEAQA